MSRSPWRPWFIHLHSHSHTDGQDFGSGQAHCLGEIRAESILCSEFKQGHLCSTVRAAVTSSVSVEPQASRTAVVDKLKLKMSFLCLI